MAAQCLARSSLSITVDENRKELRTQGTVQHHTGHLVVLFRVYKSTKFYYTQGFSQVLFLIIRIAREVVRGSETTRLPLAVY